MIVAIAHLRLSLNYIHVWALSLLIASALLLSYVTGLLHLGDPAALGAYVWALGILIIVLLSARLVLDREDLVVIASVLGRRLAIAAWTPCKVFAHKQKEWLAEGK